MQLKAEISVCLLLYVCVLETRQHNNLQSMALVAICVHVLASLLIACALLPLAVQTSTLFERSLPRWLSRAAKDLVLYLKGFLLRREL